MFSKLELCTMDELAHELSGVRNAPYISGPKGGVELRPLSFVEFRVFRHEKSVTTALDIKKSTLITPEGLFPGLQ